MELDFEYLKRCDHCDGMGRNGWDRYYEKQIPGKCETCKGSGQMLTDEGLKLRDAMNHIMDRDY
jgi:DnaJ-class molecular chaperone